MDSHEDQRDCLPPQERMAEESRQLLRQLDQDPTMIFLLERCEGTRYNLFLCDASECLLRKDKSLRQAGTLRHRVLVDGAFRGFYHVPCLEVLLDLPRLAPSRFMLDTKPYRWHYNTPWRWGFMFEKWFENSGRIDLTKMAAYFKAVDAYLEERDDWTKRNIEWQIAHGQCETECGASGCRSKVSPPECPVGDYTIEDGSDGEVCPLSDVLNHSDGWRPMLS